MLAATSFVLAAIAHRTGDAEQTRSHLDAAMDGAGELFIERWPKAQVAELFPSATIVGALRGAIADIDAQEKKDGRTASRPQLVIGDSIAPKLAELDRAMADLSRRDWR